MALPTTRLLVLAVVRLLQPVHGYDVRRELLSWHADEWANIKPGSVYGSLKTMQRDGLIAVDGVDQGGARPERTSYRITPEGEKVFGDMLREALWSTEPARHSYYAAVSLIPYAGRDDVVAALRGRILKFEADLVYLDREVERILAGSGDPRETEPHHVADNIRLAADHTRADLEWSRKTLQRIESGELDVWSKEAYGVLHQDGESPDGGSQT
ncbi:DNA-binding PadR family transcriptional regulator [Nocardia transvalensis]|uniref:DNA-binding PadR family transcriptional regulator n=1 Tax=Nocardia transvalensis TaxID=37333 RepID=A0A7W9P9W4_9NOCA|nr:PadR family transcriptional regulator [Nocardia transvalensis]MBB5911789.1 DNA-binding PadR family transcriptional regulator [Nocardia transvalensis]